MTAVCKNTEQRPIKRILASEKEIYCFCDQTQSQYYLLSVLCVFTGYEKRVIV